MLERFQAVRYRLLLIQRLEAAVGTGGFAYDGGGVSLHALREAYTVGYFGDLRWPRRRGMLLLDAALAGLPRMGDLQRPAHRQPKDVCTCLWMHIGCWEGVSINFI